MSLDLVYGFWLTPSHLPVPRQWLTQQTFWKSTSSLRILKVALLRDLLDKAGLLLFFIPSMLPWTWVESSHYWFLLDSLEHNLSCSLMPCPPTPPLPPRHSSSSFLAPFFLPRGTQCHGSSYSHCCLNDRDISPCFKFIMRIKLATVFRECYTWFDVR